MVSLQARVIIGDSRSLREIEDGTVDLAVTSPPYWNIKDYGSKNQVGFNQSLHQYLNDLYAVWQETYRALKPGTRLCLNIGDQFLRSSLYGKYKIVPLHAEFISQCEKIGFDYMGSIIWQKKTTINTTGGSTIMGSFPYPRNGVLEIDFEYILVFKKPGSTRPEPAMKEKSRLSKEEWKDYFSGHWIFSGERQEEHIAMFPDELPTRLIRMFSFVGDTILDPFLGSGTTLKSALRHGRNAIGYEINREFIGTIVEKASPEFFSYSDPVDFDVIEREGIDSSAANYKFYEPATEDFMPVADLAKKKSESMPRVIRIIDSSTVELDNSITVKLKGITVSDEEGALNYLNRYVKRRKVILKSPEGRNSSGGSIEAYLYLKNRIFINREFVRQNLGSSSDELITGSKKSVK